ncbi:DUF397 domain-containing protein [Streptomyces sp. NBC_01426]|uniref:DUF397 domain-containing protein n=1 Tax=Streptomyces sp. NBC_01426 TaxID=2975866 RepID=UPI002E370817|nr:DUF397 domain-containing protein [Streptomyces sp. NBC_01426]
MQRTQAGGADRRAGQWSKSSHSGDASGNCVETCPQPGAVQVRDSKRNDEAGAPVLGFTTTAWAAFTAHTGGRH